MVPQRAAPSGAPLSCTVACFGSVVCVTNATAPRNERHRPGHAGAALGLCAQMMHQVVSLLESRSTRQSPPHATASVHMMELHHDDHDAHTTHTYDPQPPASQISFAQLAAVLVELHPSNLRPHQPLLLTSCKRIFDMLQVDTLLPAADLSLALNAIGLDWSEVESPSRPPSAHVRNGEAIKWFEGFDVDANQRLSRPDMIKALEANPELRKLLGIPSFHQDSGGAEQGHSVEHAQFERLFQEPDTEGVKRVSWREVASAFGYKGDDWCSELRGSKNGAQKDAGAGAAVERAGEEKEATGAAVAAVARQAAMASEATLAAVASLDATTTGAAEEAPVEELTAVDEAYEAEASQPMVDDPPTLSWDQFVVEILQRQSSIDPMRAAERIESLSALLHLLAHMAGGSSSPCSATALGVVMRI